MEVPIKTFLCHFFLVFYDLYFRFLVHDVESFARKQMVTLEPCLDGVDGNSCCNQDNFKCEQQFVEHK